MANRFLNDTSGGGGDISSLKNGTEDINVQSISIQGALINSVLVTDSKKKVLGLTSLPLDKISSDGSLIVDDVKADTITAKSSFLTLQTPDGKTLYKGSEVATMADILNGSGSGILLYANYSIATTQPNLISFPDSIISGTTTITPTPTGPTFVRAFEASSTTAPATSIDITVSSVNTRECVAQWAFDTATYCVNGFITAGLWSFSIFGHAETNSLPHLNTQFSIYAHATGQAFTAENMTLIANSSKEPFLTTSPNKSVIELSAVVPYTDTNGYDYIYIVLTCENNENGDHSATYFFESDQTYSHMHSTLPISGSVSPALINSLVDKTQNIDEGLTISGTTAFNGIVKTNEIQPTSGTTITNSGNLYLPFNGGNNTVKTHSVTTQNLIALNYDPLFPLSNGTLGLVGNVVMDNKTFSMFGNTSNFLTEASVLCGQQLYSNTIRNRNDNTNLTISAVGANIIANSNIIVATGSRISCNEIYNKDLGTDLTLSALLNNVSVQSNLNMNNRNISNVNDISSTSVTTNTLTSSGVSVSIPKNIVLSSNDITGVNNMSITTINTRKPATGYFARITTLSSTGNQTNYDMIRPNLDITPSFTGAQILQADFYPGATWKLYASGTLSRNGTTQTLLSFSVNLAGAASTLIHNFQAETTVAAGAPRPWSLEYTITCNTGQSATAVFNTMAEWWHSPSATTNANIGEMAYQTAVTTTLENKFIELILTSSGSLNQFNIHQMYLQRIF